MIRSDTLMRFIRIFSELANSIRYSTNRRVQIEMALIKLCKPEAESDELSLVERIRKLERAAEAGRLSGPAGAYPGGYAGQAGTAGGDQDDGSWDQYMQGGADFYGDDQGGYAGDGVNPGGGYPGGAGVPGGMYPNGAGAPLAYPKAAPEDLQKVKSMWKSIVGSTTGMFRTVLSSAEPKFNAQNADDGVLYVVFADFIGERYQNKPEYKRELEQIIADQTGKQVQIKFVLAADEGIQRGVLSTIEIDERIHEFIHTDIEIVDEN